MRTRSAIRVLCLGAMSLAALVAPPDFAGAETVTKTADTDDKACNSDCSLREAIEATDAGGTVTLPASAQPYEVSDGLGSLVIIKDLTIAGAGARLTEVTAPGTVVRPFTVRADIFENPDVTIRDLAISGGDGNGGAIGGEGGGVLVADGPLGGASLILERVWVHDNKVEIAAALQVVGGGAAVSGAESHLTILESLIAQNRAIGDNGGQSTGGGVSTFAAGTVTIENTTIASNEALGEATVGHSALGGGVVLTTKGSSLVNVTLVGNRAFRTTGGALPGQGGNLVGAAATVRNTIVAAGAADDAGTEDCVSPINGGTSLGGNVVPPSCGPGPSDRAATDPRLGPLGNNGGGTDTLALLEGSPAIDASIGCPPPATDQRGLPRPSGSACDSGAFELQPPPQPLRLPVVKCQGKSATIAGSAGRDRLKGTKGRDVIAGLAGNDTILAGGGNDLVCAGKGKDTVKGGKGKDRLFGQKGPDILRGGPGKDKLVGGKGKDSERQ